MVKFAALPLDCCTDEIIDSMLSLSRSTSLVRWRYVGDDYRPMRSLLSPQHVVLRASSGAPVHSDEECIWSGASDGTTAIAWILRRFDYDDRAYNDDTVTPVKTPWVEITGLDSGTSLELTWFDERRRGSHSRMDS